MTVCVAGSVVHAFHATTDESSTAELGGGSSMYCHGGGLALSSDARAAPATPGSDTLGLEPITPITPITPTTPPLGGAVDAVDQGAPRAPSPDSSVSTADAHSDAGSDAGDGFAGTPPPPRRMMSGVSATSSIDSAPGLFDEGDRAGSAPAATPSTAATAAAHMSVSGDAASGAPSHMFMPLHAREAARRNRDTPVGGGTVACHLLRVALSTSMGSVCRGALFCPVAHTVRAALSCFTLDAAESAGGGCCRGSARNDATRGQRRMAIGAETGSRSVRRASGGEGRTRAWARRVREALDEFVRRNDALAFAHVAAYNKAFAPAARDVWQALEASGAYAAQVGRRD